ncbi:MAG TPA: gliding motility-associated C-terminal domain-containing protein, partial [Saprospiraceae bacterium]|nr:gliding motility-associated C-terminal domain-containing protein [Saprospiraceae bacterium]
ASESQTWIPNAFSPNGDQINDLFTLFSSNPNLMVEDFIIYDRWGNQVYQEQKKNIQNLNGWDGRAGNQEFLNPGVYVYYIRLAGSRGSEQVLRGDVSLIR